MLKIAPKKSCNIIIDGPYIHNSKRRKILSRFSSSLFKRICYVIYCQSKTYENILMNSNTSEYISSLEIEEMLNTISIPSPTDPIFENVHFIDLDYRSSINDLNMYKSTSKKTAVLTNQ